MIEHEGIVVAQGPEGVKVRIETRPACAHCHVSATCALKDIQNRTVDIADPPRIFSAGEKVTLEMDTAVGFLAVFWGYLLPFLLVFGTLAGLLATGADELTAGLSALGVTLPYYTILAFFKDRIGQKLHLRIRE